MKKKLLALLLCTSILFSGCSPSMKDKNKSTSASVQTDKFGQTIVDTVTTTDKLPARVFFYESYFDITDYQIYEEKSGENNYFDIIKVVCSCEKFSKNDCIDFIKSDSSCTAQISNLDKDNDFIHYDTIYSEYSSENNEFYFLLAGFGLDKDEYGYYKSVVQNKKAADYKSIGIGVTFSKDKDLYMTNCYLDNTKDVKPIDELAEKDFDNDYGKFYSSLDTVFDGISSLDELTVIDGYYLDGLSLDDKKKQKEENELE